MDGSHSWGYRRFVSSAGVSGIVERLWCSIDLVLQWEGGGGGATKVPAIVDHMLPLRRRPESLVALTICRWCLDKDRIERMGASFYLCGRVIKLGDYAS